MKVVFLGNNLSIHQKPLSDAMYSQLGDGYTFIATKPMDQERLDMGWKDFSNETPYVLSVTEENIDLVKDKISSADAVIIGAAKTSWIEDRLKSGKLVFRYQERPFKRNNFLGWFNLKALYSTYKTAYKWRKKNYYLLGASAYSYCDFYKLGCFRKKALKFGYFINPISNEYVERTNQIPQITWIGRHIKTKHCEMVLKSAKFLKEQSINAKFTIVGHGKLSEKLKKLCKKLDVEDVVKFIPVIPNEEIKELLLNSDVHLATSDFNEGWGVVVNESLSAGCLVIASKQMGSVPYLIEHGKNGLIFDVNKQSQLNEYLKTVVLDKNLRAKLGANAVETMKDVWSPQNTAKNLISVINKILEGEFVFGKDVFVKQPCSSAWVSKRGK